MGQFAITVEFRLKPDVLADFRKLIDRNAAMSCQQEPGCIRFDVLTPNLAGDTVFLYEIYESESAFAEHLRSEHFSEFDRLSAPMVREKHVKSYELVYEGSEQERA